MFVVIFFLSLYIYLQLNVASVCPCLMSLRDYLQPFISIRQSRIIKQQTEFFFFIPFRDDESDVFRKIPDRIDCSILV